MFHARDDIEREAAHCDYEQCLPDEACRENEGEIKVLRQKGHADDVDEKSDDFGQDHVDVPARRAHQLSPSTARSTSVAYQVLISRATIMSSFKTRAVKEIATIFKNSFSKMYSDIIMIAPPWYTEIMSHSKKVL